MHEDSLDDYVVFNIQQYINCYLLLPYKNVVKQTVSLKTVLLEVVKNVLPRVALHYPPLKQDNDREHDSIGYGPVQTGYEKVFILTEKDK